MRIIRVGQVVTVDEITFNRLVHTCLREFGWLCEFKALRKHTVKWSEKTKFILPKPLDFDPADLLHAVEQCSQVAEIMHVHLPHQRRIAVEGEMRQVRHQKILAEDEFFDGATLVGSVVNDDIGKHGDAT